MSINSPLGATHSGSIELRPGAVPGSHAHSRAGLAALFALIATVTVTVVAAAGTNDLLPESVRPVPLWLAGPLGSAGVGLNVPELLAVLAAMFVAYALTVKHAERLSARAVLMAVAGLYALVVLAPPLFSTDVFSYQSYARMFALYGANPYVHGPYAIALDPVYPFIGAKWVNTPTAYGPVFTLMSAVLAPLSIAAGVLAYKAIAAVASLALVALVWNLARVRGVDPVKAVALVGLNPLIVLYGIGGGHNDLLMVAVLMLGVSLMLQRRERAAGASVMVAAGIKLTAGLIAPFALAGAARPLARDRRREFLLGAAAAGAAVAAVGLAFFGPGTVGLLGTLAQNQGKGDWHSIPGFISTELGLGTLGHVTGVLLGIVFVGVLAWLLRRVWRGELDWIEGAAWATAALLATASSLLPWYVAWLMPLAALARDRRLQRAAIIITGVIMLIQAIGYLPLHGPPAL